MILKQSLEIELIKSKSFCPLTLVAQLCFSPIVYMYNKLCVMIVLKNTTKSKTFIFWTTKLFS